MEVVLAIASKVGEYLVKPTVNQVRYLFCFNTIVEELKEQEINLKLARDNVNKDVEIAKNNTEKIKGHVEKWLTDANEILADVEGLKEETGVKKNRGWRYWLGRKAAKKTTSMLKLADNGKFDGVGIGDASTLNPVAIKIAKECDGLPLALVVIGSALREKVSEE
ncbi:hypothetical protein Pint_04553 [Pistacia integerrima]|uniref:Uncharacterized protein n=1 Tax=Pistacia integerrima TaxID=434235 RepID=A0ACC0Z1Q9_9ROSI|nr:hypothetical protein Pint_04553 [Pistacia integerrima]